MSMLAAVLMHVQEQRECYGLLAFSGRIKSVVKVDECGDTAQMSWAILWDVEAQTCGQQSPTHVGESEQQQRPASEGVYRPHSRPSEDEIDDTKAPGGEKCSGDRGACLGEDRR